MIAMDNKVPRHVFLQPLIILALSLMISGCKSEVKQKGTSAQDLTIEEQRQSVIDSFYNSQVLLGPGGDPGGLEEILFYSQLRKRFGY